MRFAATITIRSQHSDLQFWNEIWQIHHAAILFVEVEAEVEAAAPSRKIRRAVVNVNSKFRWQATSNDRFAKLSFLLLEQLKLSRDSKTSPMDLQIALVWSSSRSADQRNENPVWSWWIPTTTGLWTRVLFALFRTIEGTIWSF
jgi:hypothetical protein